MSSNLNPFRIEILDTNNNEIGSGSIGTVIQLSDTKRLDAIGSLEFTMPAGDEKAQYITTGVRFDVYDQQDGYLGRYLFKSKDIQDNNGVAILRVVCYDYLRELSQRSVYFNRSYNFETVENILSDILSLVGWQANVSEVGTNQITYQGESVLRAVDELRDRRGVHYRLNFDKTSKTPTLDFGPFGDLLPINFEQFNGQVQSDFLRNPNNAIITSAKIIEESDEIYNRIIPLGAGQGVSQLTIENATLGDYTIQTGINTDGSNFYYIEDTTSISNYGLKERILSFPNIIPLTNSDANVTNAANTLKLTAEAYIKKHLEPRREYSIEILGLRQEILPGDKIHVRYLQQRDDITYINIDADFWVMEITRNKNVSGDRSYNIKIANVDQLRTTDQDVIVDVVRDLNSINVHIPATLAYSPVGPYVKRIKGSTTPANRINPVFRVRIKEEVLYLNRALVRVSFSPLKSSAAGAAHNHLMFSAPGAALGSVTTGQVVCADSPGAGGLYNLNLDFSSSNFPTGPLYTFQSGQVGADSIEYGVFEDVVTPDTVGMLLNGTDITLSVNNGNMMNIGGGTNEYEFDITEYMTNTGTFRITHEIEFYCETETHGDIEFECDLLVTSQPIRVTSS